MMVMVALRPEKVPVAAAGAVDREFLYIEVEGVNPPLQQQNEQQQQQPQQQQLQQ